MKLLARALLVVISIFSFSYAATLYIANAPSVPVFMQASIKSTQLRQLKQNTPVTIEDTDSTAGFALIKTTDGGEGWVALKNLATNPIATISNAPAAVAKALSQQPKADAGSLQQENAALHNQLKLVQDQAQKFAVLSTHNDLMTGAGILIFGFLLGWWVGRSQRRRNWHNRNRFS